MWEKMHKMGAVDETLKNVTTKSKPETIKSETTGVSTFKHISTPSSPSSKTVQILPSQLPKNQLCAQQLNKPPRPPSPHPRKTNDLDDIDYEEYDDEDEDSIDEPSKKLNENLENDITSKVTEFIEEEISHLKSTQKRFR